MNLRKLQCSFFYALNSAFHVISKSSVLSSPCFSTPLLITNDINDDCPRISVHNRQYIRPCPTCTGLMSETKASSAFVISGKIVAAWAENTHIVIAKWANDCFSRHVTREDPERRTFSLADNPIVSFIHKI